MVMLVLRWTLGVGLALLASAALVATAVHWFMEERGWRKRAERLRRWTVSLALLWLNLEVWVVFVAVLIATL